MKASPFTAPRARQRGISLIITLIMLVIIGLTATVSMRGAISSEKVVNNLRQETLAQQYAEAALRYCESELGKVSADRVSTLQDSQLTPTLVLSTTVPLGLVSSTWTSTPTKVTTIPNGQLESADSSFKPKAPQCFVDRVQLAGGSTTFMVTARGFSPGHLTNSDGTTKAGSVVWLQSLLAVN